MDVSAILMMSNSEIYPNHAVLRFIQRIRLLLFRFSQKRSLCQHWLQPLHVILLMDTDTVNWLLQNVSHQSREIISFMGLQNTDESFRGKKTTTQGSLSSSAPFKKRIYAYVGQSSDSTSFDFSFPHEVSGILGQINSSPYMQQDITIFLFG